MSSRHHLKQITRVRPEKSCSGLLSQMMRIVRKEVKNGKNYDD